MKIRILLISFAAAITLSSCVVEENGTMDIIDIDVPASSWNYSITPAEESNPNLKYQGNYFWAELSVPQLTDRACMDGLVKVYKKNPDRATQTELPFTRHKEIYNGPGNRYFYTETIDYEFGEGVIFIYYTVSDFDYEVDSQFVPESMRFRCVIAR